MATNVPVGGKLKFAQDLEKANSWPPKRIRRRHGDGPTATPYLVVAADPNDLGNRPISGAEAVRNASVEVIDAGGNIVTQPTVGATYSLRVRVRNLGATSSYAGVAEFFIADPATVDAAARGTGTIPIFSVDGFTALPDATIIVKCSRNWTPTDATATAASVVVNVYDLLLDPVTHRFDARTDRHVGRRNSIPDFSGTWEGRELIVPASGAGDLKRVVVAQVALQRHRGRLLAGRGNVTIDTADDRDLVNRERPSAVENY